MTDQKIYKVESSDKQIFFMTIEDINHSETLSQIVNEFEKNSVVDYTIPIPTVTGEVMKMVVEWCRKHRIDSPTTSTWSEDYFKELSRKKLFDLVWAADYLVMHALINAGSAEVAARLKGERSDVIDGIMAAPSSAPNAPKGRSNAPSVILNRESVSRYLESGNRITFTKE